MIKISFLHPEQELITRTQFNFIICVLFSRISVLLTSVIDLPTLLLKPGSLFSSIIVLLYYLLLSAFKEHFPSSSINCSTSRCTFFPTHISAVMPIVKGIQTYGFFFIPPNFSEKKTRKFFIPCSYYFSAI